MHPFSFIPFVAVLVAAACVAMSFVWDTNRPMRTSMTEIFVCLLGWALIDLCGQVETDPEEALIWLKLLHLPALVLTVCVIRVVLAMFPDAPKELETVSRVGLGLAIAIGLAATVVPGVVLEAKATAWGGWIPRHGPVSFVLIPMGSVFAAIAAYQVRRRPRAPSKTKIAHLSRLRSHAVIGAVLASIAAGLSTEFLLPLLEIPFPRMGVLVSVLAVALIWLQLLYRSEDLSIAPQATARAVLAKLHDGVAVVDLSGTILSANPRLASLVGTESHDLVGRSITDLLDISVDSILCGLEEREVLLRADSGARVSASLSTTVLRDRQLQANWVVVVCRDLRNVDTLRRRLLSSGRLAAVGELAAGIAHEVNNPVAFIRSDLNFLRSRLSEIEAQFAKESEIGGNESFFTSSERRIDAALAGIGRVAEVVGDVREFAHVGNQGAAAGDPKAIIESAVRLARLERRDDVSLEVTTHGVFDPISGGQDFKQVILALLRVMTVNSRNGATVGLEAIAYTGLLRIEFRSDDIEGGSSAQVARFLAAGENILEASAEDLGLAMAIELVDELGGAVAAEAPSSSILSILLSWPSDDDGGDA